jgi:riboflavin synthase
MFTGLVEALGTVRRLEPAGPGKRLEIDEPRLARELVLGQSVAVNGACLTVIEPSDAAFRFELAPETLSRTNLGALEPGDRVNLERSLRLGDRLDGHLVQGHVDGLGQVAERQRWGEWEVVWFRCAVDLASQMVPKGSVAVDGVSLTLVEVQQDCFSVALIPHTLAHTTLGFKTVGAAVNLETDLFGKFVWKYLSRMSLPQPEPAP